MLVAATQLTCLDLRESLHLVVSESDVRLVLARLPRLERLLLGYHDNDRTPFLFCKLPPQKQSVLDMLRHEKPGVQLQHEPNWHL